MAGSGRGGAYVRRETDSRDREGRGEAPGGRREGPVRPAGAERRRSPKVTPGAGGGSCIVGSLIVPLGAGGCGCGRAWIERGSLATRCAAQGTIKNRTDVLSCQEVLLRSQPLGWVRVPGLLRNHQQRYRRRVRTTTDNAGSI